MIAVLITEPAGVITAPHLGWEVTPIPCVSQPVPEQSSPAAPELQPRGHPQTNPPGTLPLSPPSAPQGPFWSLEVTSVTSDRQQELLLDLAA